MHAVAPIKLVHVCLPIPQCLQSAVALETQETPVRNLVLSTAVCLQHLAGRDRRLKALHIHTPAMYAIWKQPMSISQATWSCKPNIMPKSKVQALPPCTKAALQLFVLPRKTARATHLWHWLPPVLDVQCGAAHLADMHAHLPVHTAALDAQQDAQVDGGPVRV